jgi:hypothetical protein
MPFTLLLMLVNHKTTRVPLFQNNFGVDLYSQFGVVPVESFENHKAHVCVARDLDTAYDPLSSLLIRSIISKHAKYFKYSSDTGQYSKDNWQKSTIMVVKVLLLLAY